MTLNIPSDNIRSICRYDSFSVASSLEKAIHVDVDENIPREHSDLYSVCTAIKNKRNIEPQRNESLPDNQALFVNHTPRELTKKSFIIVSPAVNQFSLSGIPEMNKMTRSHIVGKTQENQQEDVMQEQKKKQEQEQVNVEKQNILQLEMDDAEEDEPKKSQTSIKKNLLRNMSMLVRDYIGSHKGKKVLRKLIQMWPASDESIEQLSAKFIKHVRDLTNDKKMNNFEGYREVWLKTDAFGYYYRYLTMKFYTEEAHCYIWKNYFMKNKREKGGITLDHLPKFIRGLQHPNRFSSWT